MSDLHPHWHATSNQQKAAPSAPSTVRVPVSTTGRSVSRAPAAIVGILVTVTVGLSVFQGWDTFLGQATENSSSSVSSAVSNEAEIHITPEGFLPPTLNATAGMKIRIINDDAIPHIIESKTMRDGSGRVLYSPALFPEQAYEFDIYEDEVSGEHRLSSTTTAWLGVTITLLAPNASSSGNALGNLDDVPLPTGGLGPSATAKSSSKAPIKSLVKSSAAKATSSAAAAAAVTTSSASSVSAAAASTTTGFGVSATESGDTVVSTDTSSGTSLSASSTDVISDVEAAAASASAAAAAQKEAEDAANALAASVHAAAQEEETRARASSSAAAAAALHAGADLHPPKNTNTGPEIWIALVGGFAGVVTVSKKHLKAFTLN